MILTLCYMYATLVQWWRLGVLRQKLSGTLNKQNALLLCSSTSCIGGDGDHAHNLQQNAIGWVGPNKNTTNDIEDVKRSLENLLYQHEGRIACTIVPRQKLNLGQWAAFPKDRKSFPLHYRHFSSRRKSSSGKVYLLMQAGLDANVPSKIDFVQMEKFGELVAWRAQEHFEVVIKSDLERITVLMNSFRFHAIGINHDLPLIKVETVDVDGTPSKLKYDRRPLKLKYSHGPAQIREFATCLRQLYSKINENLNPKIMIENGGTKKQHDLEKKPVSEVKPNKKATKHTLDVHHSSGHKKREKSHSSKEHKEHKEVTTNTNIPSVSKDLVASGAKVSKSEEFNSTVKELNDVELETKIQISDVEESKNVDKDLEGGEVKSIMTKKEEHVVVVNNDEENTPVNEVRTKKEAATSNNLCETKSDKSKDKSKDTDKVKEVKDEKHEKSKDKKDKKDKKDEKKDKKDDKKDDKEKTKETKEKSKLFKHNSKEKLKKPLNQTSSSPSTTVASTSKDKDTLSVNIKKSYSDVAASPSSTPGKNLQRQNATSNSASNSKETSPNRNAKPPNILVYADTSLAKDNVKSVLKTIINKDKYTVYDFPPNAGEGFWNSSTTLVVVCGQVPNNLTPHLLGYLMNGGQLLCLCSDLLYSVLQSFSTAEVREHELVRFSYGEWKRVKMMHHIFCYQASPAKKQFSREASDQSMNGGGSTGSSPVAPRTPSIVDIQHDGKRYTIQVQVLGAEETWQTPSLLLATVKGGAGKAVFSQVHLEVDPTQYQDDENKFSALKDSNQARLEIMKHILSSHLDIDCSTKGFDVVYTPGYFLGRHDLKMQMINSPECSQAKITLPNLQLEFLTKNIDPPEATIDKLPIMVLRCPSNFSTVEYFDTLSTQRVGRLVIYADVMASSQRLLATKLTDGLCVIARRQTQGKGRSGNDWLSPEGCAMFSLQLHIPLDSHLGRSLPLVQHLVMVGVALACKNASGLGNLEVGLKWPNDLYAYGNIKIGGLLATSTVERDMAVVTVGCGINLDNREPTICINDMIRDLDKNKVLSVEKFFAATFNEVEGLIDATQQQGLDYLFGIYYKHWLHTNSNITVTTSEGTSSNVTIKGVDSFGFLQVQDAAGVVSSVQSDGNTFDMLRGLIAPKLTS